VKKLVLLLLLGTTGCPDSLDLNEYTFCSDAGCEDSATAEDSVALADEGLAQPEDTVAVDTSTTWEELFSDEFDTFGNGADWHYDVETCSGIAAESFSTGKALVIRGQDGWFHHEFGQHQGKVLAFETRFKIEPGGRLNWRCSTTPSEPCGNSGVVFSHLKDVGGSVVLLGTEGGEYNKTFDYNADDWAVLRVEESGSDFVVYFNDFLLFEAPLTKIPDTGPYVNFWYSNPADEPTNECNKARITVDYVHILERK
jgi:hypothetical protein